MSIFDLSIGNNVDIVNRRQIYEYNSLFGYQHTSIISKYPKYCKLNLNL